MKNVIDVYPLSPLQQGIFFHSVYSDQSGIYLEQLRCTLEGDAGVSAFKQAWQKLIDRHSIFRTAFLWEGLDEPLQAVCRQAKPSWQELDWRGVPPAEQQERLFSFLKSDRELGFDLSQAPLMRMALIRVAENSYEFVWTQHHLIMDGWSLSLALNEVFSFYEAYYRGEELNPEPARPYRDYIAWLQKQDLTRAEQYWREALKGFSSPTEFAIVSDCRSLPIEEREIDDYEELSLPLSLTGKLEILARHTSTHAQ